MSRETSLARCGRLNYALITGIGALALAAAAWCVYRGSTEPAVLAVWWIGYATPLSCALLRGRRSPLLPTAVGRTVAVVTAHEQDTADLHACVWSILNQRGVVVDEVHVVDAGSTGRPVQPFAHPRVRWHRAEDSGRAAAQVYVLDRLDAADWDFVLLVDAGCVLDEQAVEHQLRAFSRPRVTAATGTVLARNARQNLLTRIADLNVGAACALPGVDRSPAGILKIASGAPGLYRAEILFRHRLRYRAAGAYGDERRLLLYAALEGEVVGVGAAVAWTAAPTGLRAAGRQRLRWSAGWWYLLPLALTCAGRLRGTAGRLALVHLTVGPLTIAGALVVLAVSACRGTLPWSAVALYAALYLLVRYAATGLYLTRRPGTGSRGRLWTWLLLTPAEAVGNLLLLLPIKYVALLRLRWHARETWRDRSTATAMSAAAPGTVYYSGYLGEWAPAPTADSDTAPADQHHADLVEQQGGGGA